MKFSLNLVSKHGGRLGTLSALRSNSELSFDTPLSLAITKTGSVPHMTKDIFHNSFSENSILCIPVQHFIDQDDVLKAFKKGVAQFASLQTHPVCVLVHDPTVVLQTGYNDASSVTIWASDGRKKTSPQKYVETVCAMRPDWYECLSDNDTLPHASKKRVTKSKNNSSKFLEKCLEIHRSKEELIDVGIFAPLLGGWDPLSRKAWSEQVAKESVDGFCLTGLLQNGTTLDAMDPSYSRRLMDCVAASLESIPAEKPRQIHGAFSVLSVLELVECGVDIFDSSSAYFATERGAAFCFPNTLEGVLKGIPDVPCLEKTPEKEANPAAKSHPSEAKRMKSGDAESCQSGRSPSRERPPPLRTNSPPSSEENTRSSIYEIALKHESSRDCNEPLVEGCECYACSNYTKAYIHHLLSVREMLGSVLLMIHNLHHWELFFKTVRTAIRQDQFGILKKFYEDYHLMREKIG